MLDSAVILRDVEELLNDHFGHLQAAWHAQAEFDRQAAAATPLPSSPAISSATAITPATNPVADFVTNVFMLFMFSVLEERIAR